MRLWMFILVTMLGFSSLAFSAEPLPLYSKIYDEQRDPFKDAVAAINLAHSTQRNVLIEIGGNWCGWCHKMDVFLSKHPKVYQALHSNYVLLKINVSDGNDNAEFMKGLPPVPGYPHMFVATGTGKVLLSKDTAELLENGQHSEKNWLTFLQQWQASATAKIEAQMQAHNTDKAQGAGD